MPSLLSGDVDDAWFLHQRIYDHDQIAKEEEMFKNKIDAMIQKPVAPAIGISRMGNNDVDVNKSGSDMDDHLEDEEDDDDDDNTATDSSFGDVDAFNSDASFD